MMFRKLKISDSKVQKIKLLISNIRKVNFYLEIGNDEIFKYRERRNMKIIEVMEIWEIVKTKFQVDEYTRLEEEETLM